MDQSQIRKANNKLDKVKILQRGERLSLRAVLPPKPGDGSKPKRYTISTGLKANKQGLKLALAKAQELESQIIFEKFSWGGTNSNITVAQAIVLFERNYWNTRQKTLDTIATFKLKYLKNFHYLPQSEMVTADLLRDALLNSSEVNSSKRKDRAIAYGALLNFLEIEHDLKKYQGNYQPTIKRKIPSLEEIDYYYENHCKSPQWKWIYGIIAWYGIRPHEIFHLDTSMLGEYPPILKVLENTKTGSRIVYPIPDANKVIEWNLKERVFPNFISEGKSNRELGAKISRKYIALGIPSPYHFRDAYAVRGEVHNFNPATVSQWMGHTLKIHYQKYLVHIEKIHLTDAWLSRQKP